EHAALVEDLLDVTTTASLHEPFRPVDGDGEPGWREADIVHAPDQDVRMPRLVQRVAGHVQSELLVSDHVRQRAQLDGSTHLGGPYLVEDGTRPVRAGVDRAHEIDQLSVRRHGRPCSNLRARWGMAGETEAEAGVPAGAPRNERSYGRRASPSVHAEGTAADQVPVAARASRAPGRVSRNTVPRPSWLS